MIKQHKSRIHAAEMKNLRQVRGVTQKDRFKNDYIINEVGMKSDLNYTKQRQLSWMGTSA